MGNAIRRNMLDGKNILAPQVQQLVTTLTAQRRSNLEYFDEWKNEAGHTQEVGPIDAVGVDTPLLYFRPPHIIPRIAVTPVTLR